MTQQSGTQPHIYKLVAISAGLSDPSTTRLLLDRIAQAALEKLAAADAIIAVACGVSSAEPGSRHWWRRPLWREDA